MRLAARTIAGAQISDVQASKDKPPPGEGREEVGTIVGRHVTLQ